MKKNRLQKFLLSLCAMGILFTSCEKEEVNESLNVDAVEMEEAPFTNYMVITEGNELSKSMESFLKMNGSEIVNTIPEIGIAIVSTTDKNFIENTLKNKEVVSVIPDYEIAWIPSDVGVEAPGIGNNEFFYNQQYLWGMEAIDAESAWDLGFTGQGASVFVLDSGIDPNHRDLAPNVNRELSVSFIQNENWFLFPSTTFNHGTHVAGTIAAAQTNYGIIGVAPNAELVAVKVLSELSGNGPFSAINAGMVYAGNNGADVINMSLGATLNKNGTLIDANGVPYRIPAKYIMELVNAQQRAADYASRMGSTIIASAGNDGINYDGHSSYIKLPAGLNNVISISATAPEGYDYLAAYTNFDIPASYTTHGRSLVDFAAPGGDSDVAVTDMILSAGNNNSFYWSAGTSMAAPHVAGVAALIIGKNGGQMDPLEVEKKLTNTSDKVDGNGNHVYFGQGRVNAYRAVTE
ncbi:MAG TPA: S8 family serine peptidase [Anditalea sp.]|nr:S8 family serine peptidase [Anditalea sp.]